MMYPRIRALREDRDLKQREIASYLGIAQRTYANYEKGERTIPPEVLIKIADYYAVTVDYILGHEVKEPQ